VAEGDGKEQATGAHTGTPDVFISYASHDTAIANALCDALEQAGIPCWLAPRDVRPGDFYADAIVQAITHCRVLILLLSQAAIDSPHVLREVERASSKKRPIITFRTDSAPLPPALEYFLSASQWLDASGGPADRQFSKLIEAVRSRGTSSPNIRPNLGNIGGTPPKQNRKGPLVVVTVIIATALVYLVADKVWLSKRVANEQSTPATTNLSAPPPPNPVSRAPAFDPPPHSIAVLPFVNMSGDAKEEYFSDGVTEELLNSLSRLNELQVVARTSSFSFKGQNVDVSTIAHKLNVGTILEGSVRRAGNTVRITVQLINGVSGFHVWSQTYDRKFTDILKVQTEVATTVAQQLKVTLAGDETAKLELGSTKNASAYEAYLRGAELLSNWDFQEADVRAALAAFDQAIALDPNYALAYAKRASAFNDIAVFYAEPAEIAGVRGQALRAAERAVALAPELGEAHLALANVLSIGLLNFGGALPEFDRALALSPGSARVQRDFAGFAGQLGHTEDAILAARRAVSLDPQNVDSQIILGQVLLWARDYAESLTALRAALLLRSNSIFVRGNIANTLLASGQFDQARLLCESPSLPPGDDGIRQHCLAMAYRGLGRQREAEHELEEFKSRHPNASIELAGLYAQRGDRRLALEMLARAEQQRDSAFQVLRVYWALDPIRNEPEFKAIEARMNFPP